MLSHLNDDVFTAIAHPLRRSLLDELSRGSQPVNQLARRYDVSRPAISQHLRILLDAGLVEGVREGRTNTYQLQADRLSQVYEWLRQYERFWSDRMADLGRILDREAAHNAPAKGSQSQPKRRNRS